MATLRKMQLYSLGALAWRWTRCHAWRWGALLLAAAGCHAVLSFMAGTAPGAGAAYQEAPNQVEAGDSVGISLRLAVRGAGGAAGGRYRDVRLLVQTDRNVELTTLRPVRMFEAADGTTYRFEFKVAPEVRSVDYRFRLRFDNQRKEIPGLNTIAIR